MAETPRLRRFGAAEGLPSRMVVALAEDRQGHIWAATDGGLARYDGNSLRVWEHDPEQPGSLPGNEIETLLIDPLDRSGWASTARAWPAWMPTASASGPSTRSIPPARAVLGAGLCRRCLVDRDQQPWRLPVGEDGSVRLYTHDPAQPGACPATASSPAWSMRRAACGWAPKPAWRVGTAGFEPVAARELGTLSVLRLSRDAEGSIWVGSQNDGLYRIDGQDRVSRPRWADSAQLRSALVLADRQGATGLAPPMACCGGMRRRCAGWRATAAAAS
jgi:hypothetical protein